MASKIIRLNFFIPVFHAFLCIEIYVQQVFFINIYTGCQKKKQFQNLLKLKNFVYLKAVFSPFFHFMKEREIVQIFLIEGATCGTIPW